MARSSTFYCTVAVVVDPPGSSWVPSTIELRPCRVGWVCRRNLAWWSWRRSRVVLLIDRGRCWSGRWRRRGTFRHRRWNWLTKRLGSVTSSESVRVWVDFLFGRVRGLGWIANVSLTLWSWTFSAMTTPRPSASSIVLVACGRLALLSTYLEVSMHDLAHKTRST